MKALSKAVHAAQTLELPLRQWIAQKKWTSLRPIQHFAIQALTVQGIDDADLILSAPTAGGKTAAALLPVLNRLAVSDAKEHRSRPPESFEILFISPLRALIRQQAHPENDVVTMANSVNGRQVHPWMSDISRERKDKSWDDPNGILLITPESLESVFLHRPHEMASRFQHLTAVIIDELHAYFDNPRGAQLMSLLKRLEVRLERTSIQRIALSATLGDGGENAEQHMYRFLRPPHGNAPRRHIQIPDEAPKQTLKLAEDLLDVRINVEPEADLTERGDVSKQPGDSAERRITAALRAIFDRDEDGPRKGLIFTNSRHDAEHYAALLEGKAPTTGGLKPEWEPELVDEAQPPEESADESHDSRRYRPHHGSLNRKDREAAERRMLKKDAPCVLVCTTTLELGIDIGEINEVAQIGPGPSVASLRQRLGRSGRMSGLVQDDSHHVPAKVKGKRPQPPRLHIFLREPRNDDDAPLIQRLHLQTFQSLAQVELLREKKFEIPHPERLNLSTLVQQVVSLVREYREEGLTLGRAKEILVLQGPFHGARERLYREDAKTIFEAVIHRLATRHHPLLDYDYIDGVEGDDVELFLAPEGEELIARRLLYTSFQTPVEYTVRSGRRILGTAALTAGLTVGDRIVFSGKPWEVSEVSHSRRTVDVRPAFSGRAVHFTGDAVPPSEPLVKRMKELYELPTKEFERRMRAAAQLNGPALSALREGHDAFAKEQLARSPVPAREKGPHLWIYPWLGERRLNGLYLLLKRARLPVARSGLALLVLESSRDQVASAIRERLSSTFPPVTELVRGADGASSGKFGFYLNPSLRRRDFAESQVDLSGLRDILNVLSDAVRS